MSLNDCRGSAWAFQQLMRQAKAEQIKNNGAAPMSRIERHTENRHVQSSSAESHPFRWGETKRK